MIKVGKLGIVRLTGKDYDVLRLACWERDEGKCRNCGKDTFYNLSHEHSDSYHMAHIRTKRNNGDTLENVRTLCGDCHRAEHNPKVVPKKTVLTDYYEYDYNEETMSKLTCKKCGHKWEARVKDPKACPACKSYQWREN